jgi:type II secretion system protein I
MTRRTPASTTRGATGSANALPSCPGVVFHGSRQRVGKTHWHSQWHPKQVQAGFSLLEVILALAILAGSLAALGEVMRQADRNASLSGDETQAQIIASSIMDELISGYRTLAPVTRMQYDALSEPPWLYSIEIASTNFTELIAVRISVEQEIEARLQPARFELTRWMMNPDYTASSTDSEGSSSESSTSSSSTGSSSSSSSSTSGGSAFGTGGTGGGP